MIEPGIRGRLLNAGGELLAEGVCWVNEPSGQATLEPERTPGVLQKQRGHLVLELETGRSLKVSDKAMIVRIMPNPGNRNGNGRRSLYRLRLMNDEAQEANAAGAAGEGAPASRDLGGLRVNGETPAAR